MATAASRFWKGDSDSASESGDDSESEDDVQLQRQVGKRFEGAFESDSDSEDEARVVKSAKDKTWDTLHEIVVRIRNALKTNDWSIVQDEFDEVNKQVEKAKMLIAKEGLPKFYVKILADVEDALSVALKDKEGIKKMKPQVSKALNRMKLTVRKHNKKYEVEINDYREHPEKYVEESVKKAASSDDSDEDSDEESEEEVNEAEDKSDEDEDSDDEDDDDDDDDIPKAKAGRGDSDDDSLFDDEDEDSEDSDSDTGEDGRPELKGRARWLKKVTDTTGTDKKEQRRINKLESQKKKKKDDTYEGATVTKLRSAWRVEDNMTLEALDKKVSELVGSRGKKGTDVKVLLRQLSMLSKAARQFGPRKEIPVVMHFISAMFDSHKAIDDYMELNKWRTCHNCMQRVVTLLEENKDIVLGLLPSEDVSDSVLNLQVKMGGKSGVEEAGLGEASDGVKRGFLQVVGNLEAFIARLEDEYTKSLQQINPHTKDYVVRLSDEAVLVELAERVEKYYRKIGNNKAAATVALMQVEHLYYKHDSIASAVRRAHLFNKKYGRYTDLHPACLGKMDGVDFSSGRKKGLPVTKVHPAAFMGNPTVAHVSVTVNPEDQLEQLCSFIYSHGDERSKTRALLCAVYHHSLHDRYYRARDLFLISHIQETIDKADTKTQILYNRALVTLGLAAFRQGHIQKAHDCLSTICSGRVKELLAQGQSRWYDRDPEQEKAERRRQMPYHMHINPDLLDCCHLTCAMLLELPQIAKSTPNQNIISKHFRKHMQTYNRQVFTGPPENTREHVLAAAKCMLSGNWKRACQYVTGLEVWNLIPNDGGAAVKDMLSDRIKEESLRIFLLSYGAHYESLSLAKLCEMFEMDQSIARRIISKMIFQREIFAAWDQPPDALILQKAESSPLQIMAQLLADKLGQFVESNERLLDPLAGSYGYKDEWTGRDGRKKVLLGPGGNVNTWKGSTQSGTNRFQNSGGGGGGGGGGRGRGGNYGRGSGGRQGGGKTDRHVTGARLEYARAQGRQQNYSGGRDRERESEAPSRRPMGWALN